MIEFFKMQGTGNDFVVVPDVENRYSFSTEAARRICDRHFGVGADGLIRIGRSGNGLFFMDYRNADGSIAEMCGNGVRCVGKWLGDHGYAVDSVDLDTRDGVKPLQLLRGTDGLVERVVVNMGVPRFDDLVTETLVCDGREFVLSSVSMGNPHAVMFVDDVDAVPLEVIAPLIQAHDRFPQSVNVEVASVEADGSIRERTFERGVGETLACGTAACAVTVAAHRRGLTGERIDMEVRGGRLQLQWAPGNPVIMEGPAVEVFRGELSDVYLEG